MTKRGFTFVEILVAMILMGIISTAMYQVLNNNQRLYREQAARIELNQNTRMAANILPTELRELDATDPNGSDIGFMNDSSMGFRSWRNTSFLCQVPDSANLKIIIAPTPWYGLDSLDITDQKFVVYAENNFTTRTDDQWYPSTASAVVAGTACPLGALSTGGASRTITVTTITKSQLSGVQKGAPMRGYKATRIWRYADASGDYWLGLQTQSPTTNVWTSISPIVGPVTATGLVLTFFDTLGVATTATNKVARIGIAVSGRTQDKQIRRGGAPAYITSDLSSMVALRNNRRW
jgi:prepilin-type N-terminal cleavage/methylation domain-containing protein